MLKIFGWIYFGDMDAIFHTFLGHNSENCFFACLLQVYVFCLLENPFLFWVVDDRSQILNMHKMITLQLVDLGVPKRSGRAARKPGSLAFRFAILRLECHIVTSAI